MFKIVLPLTIVIFFRFFGLFIVLPVLAIYTTQLPGATPILTAMAIGGYALTQIIFQIPFGYLSDKWHRKHAIVIGTIIFIIGSFICYIATDIYWLIIGRLLQGAGAVAAVIAALVTDLVKEEVRFKAMALIGGSIAIGFSISMIIGPLLNSWYGIDFLFLLASFFGIISLVVIGLFVPNPPKVIHHYNEKPDIIRIMQQPSLAIMNLTNFLQKGIMTCTFVIVPIILINNFNWLKSDLFKIYLPATLIGIMVMGPASIFAEKKNKPKYPLIAGLVLFAFSYVSMGFFDYQYGEILFLIGVISFFIGFNIHEPILQSLTSKLSKVHQRGLSLGIFNTFGYIGTFVGSILGALVVNSIYFQLFTIIFVCCCVIWYYLIVKMKDPTLSKNLYLTLDSLQKDYNIPTVPGILEYYINENEQLLIIKYDSMLINDNFIKKAIIK